MIVHDCTVYPPGPVEVSGVGPGLDSLPYQADHVFR
jgi:hypothetical protein